MKLVEALFDVIINKPLPCQTEGGLRSTRSGLSIPTMYPKTVYSLFQVQPNLPLLSIGCVHQLTKLSILSGSPTIIIIELVVISDKPKQPLLHLSCTQSLYQLLQPIDMTLKQSIKVTYGFLSEQSHVLM